MNPEDDTPDDDEIIPTPEPPDDEDDIGVQRLSRDLVRAARTLGRDEARYLVDAYYQVQGYRIRTGNQVRALSKSGEPHDLIGWQMEQNRMFEGQIKRALAEWANVHPETVWAQTIKGIGPVLSAGLRAHIDIEQAPTVGHIWRFAGLDPTSRWEKGQKRPWNADLKTLCWKIGESFVKVSSRDDDVYGKVYLRRKEMETARSEAGLYSEQAAAGAARVRKETEAYKSYVQGKLPAGHLHARAKRYATKLFLSAFHEVAYFTHYGTLPPMPYILTQAEHTHWRMAPNPDGVPGLVEAQAKALDDYRRKGGK